MQVDLDARHTLIVAILVLFAGRWINGRVHWLRKYSIPEPVTGGLVAALLVTALHAAAGLDVRFHLDARDTLLIVFFTTVGLSARVATLVAGGRTLVLVTLLAVATLVLQNVIGIGVMKALGQPAAAGLLAGSTTLAGGHGTALAWAPILAQSFGLPNAAALGAAAATFGLVVGGVLGGPLAEKLLLRHRLSGNDAEPLSVGVAFREEGAAKLDVQGVLLSLLVIAIAMVASDVLNDVLAALAVTLPHFVTALFAAIVLTNVVPIALPRVSWPAGSPPMALISDLALGLFLAMSLMSLNLASLASAALPLLATLAVQVAVCLVLLYFVVFRVLGADYDAAVMTGGFFGISIGATPTAIAVMTALTKVHGASPRAFIVIPLVGAFFIDIANAIVLGSFVRWLS
jgi:glutamate:Na+ symporter, ESS family